MFGENLKQAMRDYQYLLNRNYPQKSSLKLVGDKYQLSGEERSILYRGISDAESALFRKQKLTHIFKGRKIYIDVYNILFTLANYLNGRPVFISTDGFLRDAGELRGRFSQKKLLEQTLAMICNFILASREKEYKLFLDQPVSNSGTLSERINIFFKCNRITGNAETCDSPDYRIINEAGKEDVVCTSDSVIIERVNTMIYDLSLNILQSHFKPNFPDLSEFIEKS